MKISELTFESICKVLGKQSFNMHTKAEDFLRTISSNIVFENARKELTSSFGDVEISLHPGSPWYDEVQIEDENWKKKYDEYCTAKSEWCAKYGCD